MTWMKIVFLSLAVAITGGSADANWQQHVVSSPILGERTIRVLAPDRPVPGVVYPVLYLLDGESNAVHAQAVSEFLTSNNRAPEMIIVAIEAGSTRTEDYLPAASSEQGEAEQFLSFVGDTLVPFVEKRYPAAPLRLFSGHSYGGVFGLHAAANQPELFAAYFLQSPYLDGKVGAPVLEKLSKQLPDIDRSLFIFAKVGGEPDLAPGVRALDKILRDAQRPNVRWVVAEDLRQSHMTTRMTGLYDALDHYFGDQWALDHSALKANKDDAVDRHLAALRQQFGYDLVYSDMQFAHATQGLLAVGEIPAAGRVAHDFVRAYPDLPLPHLLRAQTLAMTGDLDGARGELRRTRKILDDHPERDDWKPFGAAVEEMTRAIR